MCDGVTRVLGEITEEIRAKAEEHTKSHLCSVDSMDALNAALNEGKVAVVHWCRERGCGDAIEEKANSSILGTERPLSLCRCYGRDVHHLRETGEGNAGRADVLTGPAASRVSLFFGSLNTYEKM